MGRYHCHGNCPVYNLIVQSDGSVFFEGIEFTKMIGKTEGNVSKEKVNEQLIGEIKKANFFSFKDDYSSQSKNCNAYATDGPGVISTVKFDEIEKTINHSSNCFVNDWLTKENELKTLTNLENKIDEIVETKRWIGEKTY